MIPNDALPHQSVRRIQGINNQIPIASKSENDLLEFEIHQGLTSLGIARIWIMIEVPDISFDVTVGVKKTLNQIAGDFKFQVISTTKGINIYLTLSML
ncbi:MAG: hypothetical protein ACI8UX_000991 [Psychromonas sp.]